MKQIDASSNEIKFELVLLPVICIRGATLDIIALLKKQNKWLLHISHGTHNMHN